MRFKLYNLTIKSGTARYILQFYSADSISSVAYMRSNAKLPVECVFTKSSPGSYTRNGFCQVDSEKIPGVYQFGVPNEAFIAGATNVIFYFRSTSNPIIISVELKQEKSDLMDVNVAQIAKVNVSAPGTPGGLIALDTDGNLTVDRLVIKEGISIAKPEQGNAIDILTENGHGINIVAKGNGKEAINLWPKNV